MKYIFHMSEDILFLAWITILVGGALAMFIYSQFGKSKTSSVGGDNGSDASGGGGGGGGGGGVRLKSSTRKFEMIKDRYTSMDEVQSALRSAGLESSELILGIDFTKSNTWQGKKSFGGKCLHDISTGTRNPYEIVIEALGRCLEPFDDDNLIPVFGFGDIRSKGKSLFAIGDGPCNGFTAVRKKYREAAAKTIMSGPTNFAPVIDAAVRISKKERSYHILVIIADGQVTMKGETVASIVRAAETAPLSIIIVGVGDGPWDAMREFDDELPARRFDNVQFVEFNKAWKGDTASQTAQFALRCLMEIPEQYQLIKEFGLF